MQAKQPFTIALTGGIAAGKTLVSDTFATLGAAVIDTDVIAHQLVEPGATALNEISHVFGSDILSSDGRLNRKALRALIFTRPDARKQLESILHPRIRHEVEAAMTRVRQDYCILVIPLLVERSAFPAINRVLLVDVGPEIRIKRLMARDHSSHGQAELALASQPSRAQRLKIADDILGNSGPAAQTRAEVAKLHKKYTELAACRT